MSNLINIIDLEATCWDKNDTNTPENKKIHEIIEIGITVLNLDSLLIVSTESILVKPTHSTISSFCTRLTTLTQAQIDQSGISLEAAMGILSTKYHAATRLFASYGNYDAVQFRKELSQHHIPFPFDHRHCNIKALVADFLQLKKQVGMSEALKMFNIPLQGTHHRGSDDSRNIAVILQSILTSIRKNPARYSWLLVSRYHLTVPQQQQIKHQKIPSFTTDEFPPLS